MARKKVIDLDTYSALDAYCIGLNEFYKSLRKGGFSVELALAIITDRNAYPEWILPSQINPGAPGDEEPWDDED